MHHRLHGFPQIILSEKSLDNLHNPQSRLGTLYTQRASMPYPACLCIAGIEGTMRKGSEILKHKKWRSPQADNPRRMRVYSGLQGWNKENAQQEQAWNNGVRNNLLT